MKQKIEIYDTTLRDGSQSEKVSFSLEDKLHLVQRFDEIGFDYLEGGWPLSNPKDEEFFRQAGKLHLRHTRITAFGSTRKTGTEAAKDRNLQALLAAETEVVTLVGKSWELHAAKVLRVSPEENLELIYDSIRHLKKHGRRVFFDAEHFFDGWRENREYALKSLRTAEEAGAEQIILCDTTGGAVTTEITAGVTDARQAVSRPLGIHCHNDCGLATANTLAAVSAGATQVQGTVNGLGERCGNADLITVIAILQLKMGYLPVKSHNLRHLTHLSRFVYELANLTAPSNQPFVGASAFAHKGGIHVDAVIKEPRTYEHINPALVGNERRILISELSGEATILSKIKDSGIREKGPETKKILAEVARLEKEGYQFEAAEASFQLLVTNILGKKPCFFELTEFQATVEHKQGLLVSHASVKVRVKNREERAVAEGDGPVNALDAAIRKALLSFYPSLNRMRLTDYRVKVLNPEAATAAKVRVLVESGDDRSTWGTVGLSENIIEASVKALIDSIEYKLLKDQTENNA